MNKRFIILGVIIFLTAGVCLATVFDYYVKMQGTAETTAPEFYIGSAEEETLLINEKADYCVTFSIDGEYRTFKTKLLGGVDFSYSPKGQFSVRAKVATTTPQDLILSFGYYDMGGIPHYLYSRTVVVNNILQNYTSDFVQCGQPANVKNFFYEFQKGCPSCDYTISKCAGGFYTKVELSK